MECEARYDGRRRWGPHERTNPPRTASDRQRLEHDRKRDKDCEVYDQTATRPEPNIAVSGI
jgi:hypothetical protein